MRKFGLLVIFCFALAFQSFSQTSFYAVNSGNWNGTNVWSTDGVTPIACSPCNTPGTHYPGPLDDAYTNGRAIIANIGATCKNLAVSYDIAGSLAVTGSLTITGSMAGWWDLGGFGLPRAPIVNVFSGVPTAVIFTAANNDGVNPFFLGNGEVLSSWNSTAPFGATIFNLAKNAIVDGGDPIFGLYEELRFASVTINGGTSSVPLQLQTGLNLDAIRATSIVVGANTTLHSNVPISGATGTITTAFLSSASIIGRIIAGSYLNANTVTISATGTLQTAFNGPNQTTGWWFGSTSPSITSTPIGSTVIFDYEGDQRVPTRAYGNLILDGGGTKQMVGANPFNVVNLSVMSEVTLNSVTATGRNVSANLVVDGTWQPVGLVSFTGTVTTPQSISGTGTLSFGGGISKTSTSALTFNKSLTIAGGITVAAGSLNLGDGITTLSSGNFSMTGNVLSGTSGELIVSGNSTFSGAGSLLLNHLTISNPVTLNINNSIWSIGGDLANNGSLVLPTDTRVTFVGGSLQTISGNAFSIGNMRVIKPSATLQNNGNVLLRDSLSMITGTFDADGGGSGIFTLHSDINGDAHIGQMAGGSIEGEVVFRRFFNNSAQAINRWRNIGFPVSSVDRAELTPPLTLPANSVSYYTETVGGNVNQGWSYVASGNLVDKRGHSIKMANTGALTLSVKGPLLKDSPADSGDPYDFGVTYFNDPAQPATEDGWNYVANPFAAPIKWNRTGWVKTRVNAVAAVWDVQNFTYRYTGGDWDGIVGQGQAFWVQTNAANPVLTCQESVKIASFNPAFYRMASESSKLFISLNSGDYTDKTFIQFRDDATPEFDTQYDASKLQNPIFNLSTMTRSGLSLAVNNLPKGPCASNVFLNVTNAEPGSYNLKFEGISSIDGLESAILTDHLTGERITLTGSTSYTFDVSADPATYGSSRFELTFIFPTSETEELVINTKGNLLVSNYETGTQQWFLNGTMIDGATETAFRPHVNGNYALEVMYKGCSLRSAEVLVDGIGRVYPNPVVSNDLNVQVSDLVPDGLSGEISITSALGVPVKQVTFSHSDTIKVIDMRSVSPGQYIVSIYANSKVIERVKIIVR